MTRMWRKGRGKLGVLEPLIGVWDATAESPMGPIGCRRSFSKILRDTSMLLEAEWRMPGGKRYLEHAIYSVGDSGKLEFWSFTSDGKRARGVFAAAKDIHPEAIAFEAQMPAGLARMIYWPGDDGGMNWAVESRSKKGWKRFTHHRYVRQ